MIAAKKGMGSATVSVAAFGVSPNASFRSLNYQPSTNDGALAESFFPPHKLVRGARPSRSLSSASRR